MKSFKKELVLKLKREMGLSAITANSSNIIEELAVRHSNIYFYRATRGIDAIELKDIDVIRERYLLPEGVEVSQRLYLMLYQEAYEEYPDHCVGLVELIEHYPDEKTLFIKWLMLNERYQRTGLGKEMVNAIFSLGYDFGYEKFRLACYDSNERGLRFWKNLGFKPVGEAPGIALKSGRKQTLLVLEK